MGKRDLAVGIVACMQTHGSRVNWHPSLCLLVTDGGCRPDGTFVTWPAHDTARRMKRAKLAGLRRHAKVVLENLRDRQLPIMFRTILREGPFRLFFFSREEPRMHVHVSHPDGEAKFWIEPELSPSVVVGLSPRQVADAEDIVRRHHQEIRDVWVRHFGR
jgi:hypothetical protein